MSDDELIVGSIRKNIRKILRTVFMSLYIGIYLIGQLFRNPCPNKLKLNENQVQYMDSERDG